MQLVYPLKKIDAFPTNKLVEECVNSLVKEDNAFLILKKDEMTYVQILNTDYGVVLQFQEGSVESHFEFDEYLSRPKAIYLLQSYVSFNEDWNKGFEYHKVNVQGFWGRLGYKLGLFFGRLLGSRGQSR